MSFVKDALFGTKGTPSQVVNTTPQAFQQLSGPLAQQLMQMLGNPQQFQGPYTAPMGAGETQGLAGVQGAAGQVGTGMGGGTSYNPFASLTGLEQFGLGQVAGQAFGQNPMMGPNMGAIQQQAFGYNPLQNTVNQQLQMIAGGGPNPMLDQLIQSATRPIVEQFGDDQLAQRGAFTAAGQQVQGRGSSPFAQASARLSTGAMNAVGDVSTRIAGQEQQRQLAALGMAQQQPGMQLQNMLAGAGFGDQTQNNALQRALAGLGAAGTGQERQGAAFESQQGRQLQGNQQQLTGQMAQLEAQLQNLQAQGLPRMIQQLGIDAGLNQFNQQQTQLLQLMQLMGGLASPNAAVLPGTAGTPGALQGLAGGIGQGLGTGLGTMLGGALSDRRTKRDIVHVATLPSGTKLYQFRYIEGEVTHVGVMADEVAHIPGAVTIDDITGLATVDYRKVA